MLATEDRSPTSAPNQGFLDVTPPIDLVSSGEVGGPVAPYGINYGLRNIGSAELTWEASASEPWVLLTNTEGDLDPSESTTVGVAIDSAQTSAMEPGTYTAQVTFTDPSGREQSTASPEIIVTVYESNSPPRIRVRPPKDFKSSGDAGGPFTPRSKNYTITNKGGGELHWQATCSAPWVVPSPASGTLVGGDSASVALTIDVSQAADLAPGTYTADVAFHNLTGSAGDSQRTVTLTVRGASASMEVDPPGDFASSGAEGGPFTPASSVYELTNSGEGDLEWRVTTGRVLAHRLARVRHAGRGSHDGPDGRHRRRRGEYPGTGRLRSRSDVHQLDERQWQHATRRAAERLRNGGARGSERIAGERPGELRRSRRPLHSRRARTTCSRTRVERAWSGASRPASPG